MDPGIPAGMPAQWVLLGVLIGITPSPAMLIVPMLQRLGRVGAAERDVTALQLLAEQISPSVEDPRGEVGEDEQSALCWLLVDPLRLIHPEVL
ncbi:MAG: hypothetical protein EOM91_12630 [Sphingobacteriia bacterium]|nr:hypothetical protein [Sphingobacteriia bacterium]NCC39658.1 hypothetical protein [Gammaproteobacteria bacterium]